MNRSLLALHILVVREKKKSGLRGRLCRHYRSFFPEAGGFPDGPTSVIPSAHLHYGLRRNNLPETIGLWVFCRGCARADGAVVLGRVDVGLLRVVVLMEGNVGLLLLLRVWGFLPSCARSGVIVV